MDKLLQEIDALKARWMTGGDSAGLGPKDWQGMDDLSLLAMAGQFSRIATRPGTQMALTSRPDLPDLGLPALAHDLRPLFRRVLDDKLAEPVDVVRLIAARGYGVNPIDWMPKRKEVNLPPIYEVWQDWRAGNLPENIDDQLTAASWDTAAPSRRYSDLTQMHRHDPDAARALITEIAPTLGADQRLRMLECLRPALTQDDASLLADFLGDRSSKVQSLVKTQLARLGTGPETDADAVAELPDFVEVAKAGFLSRKQVVQPRKLKTDAQKKRRSQVFAQVSLSALAETLGVTADAVIDTWAFGQATDDLAQLVSASGTDAQVSRLVQRCLEAGIYQPNALIDRLDASQRQTFGLQVMAHEDVPLTHTRQWIAEPDGTVGWHVIARLKLRDLTKALVDPEKPGADTVATQSIAFLSLLADRDAANRLLDHLTSAGLMSVDPRLTLLRLNAAL